MSTKLAFPALLSIGFLAGCPGIQLKPTDPTTYQVDSVLQNAEGVIYNTDRTFAPKPSDWIGRVGIVRATKDPTTGNPTCSKSGKVEWIIDRVGSPATLDYNEVDPTKRLLYKEVVDQKFAAKLDVMKYLQAEVSGDTILKVQLTEIAKQRFTPGAKWDAAINSFQTEKKAAYLEPADICYVFTVGGYSYNLLVKERFVKFTGKAAASYAAVNVNGEYYNTSERFALDDVFALSLEIMRRPPAMGSGDGIAHTAADRKPSDNDMSFLRVVAPNAEQKTGDYQPGHPAP